MEGDALPQRTPTGPTGPSDGHRIIYESDGSDALWLSMPLVIPERDPCPYCENFAGRYAWHGPPPVIAEDDTTAVFLAPASLGGMDGHTLVTTRRHVETIFDLTPDEEVAIGHAVARAARAVRSAFDPDGVLIQQHNGVAAFQTVPHFHVHVIPKRRDAPFPPLEEIPVTPPEERVEIARRLRDHWQRV